MSDVGDFSKARGGQPRLAVVAALITALLLGACAGSEFKRPSLYQRLGGKGGLVVIVDAWLARAAADPATAAYFRAGEGDRIRPLLVDQLCELAGGPCRYAGRDMKIAHAGLRIDRQAYEAMLDSLGRALDEVRVPAADKDALFKLLAPLRKDVIAISRAVGTRRLDAGGSVSIEEAQQSLRQPVEMTGKRSTGEAHVAALAGELGFDRRR